MKAALIGGLLLVVLLPGLLYWSAPNHDRLPNDELVVWSNPAVTGSSLLPILQGRFFDSSRDGFRPALRPVATLALRIEFALFHQDRTRYQWVQIILLALDALLFQLLCLRFFHSRLAALLGGAMLVAHPLAGAPVLELAGASDLLALGFSLLALLAAWRVLHPEAPGASLSLGLLAVLVPLLLAVWCKESAVALIPALWLWAWARQRESAEGDSPDPARGPSRAGHDATRGGRIESSAIALAGGAGLVLLLFLAHRAIVTATLPHYLRIGVAVEAETGLSWGRRVLLGVAAVPTGLRLLLVPFSLGYSNDDLLSPSHPGWRVLGGGLVLVALAALLIRSLRRGSDLALWASLSLFPLLAAAGMVGPAGEILAPRLLFMVVPGMTGLILRGGEAVRSRMSGAVPRLAPLAAGLILVVFWGVRTRARSHDYIDWETLVRSQVATRPASARGHFDLGNIYLTRQQWDAAVSEYTEALRLRGDYWMAYVNLGSAYFGKEESGLAMRAFERVREALQGKPEFATVDARSDYNRALILMRQSRNQEAAAALTHMLEIFPDHVFSHANLGFLLANNPRTMEQARLHLRRAEELETDPDRQQTLRNYLRKLEENIQVDRRRTQGLPPDTTASSTSDPKPVRP